MPEQSDESLINKRDRHFERNTVQSRTRRLSEAKSMLTDRSPDLTSGRCCSRDDDHSLSEIKTGCLKIKIITTY